MYIKILYVTFKLKRGEHPLLYFVEKNSSHYGNICACSFDVKVWKLLVSSYPYTIPSFTRTLKNCLEAFDNTAESILANTFVVVHLSHIDDQIRPISFSLTSHF